MERNRRAVHLPLLALVSIIAWNSIDYASGRPAFSDSGMFASIGYHLLEGRALYRDVWDHKQPIAFFLNAAALGAGDGTIDAVRTLQRVFAIASAILFYLIVARVFSRPLLAFIGTFLYLMHFYNPAIHTDGNYTEEYGAAFALAGIYCALRSKGTSHRHARELSSFAGMFFGLAICTKAPFALSALPWLAYVAAGAPGAKRRFDLRGASAFLMGSCLPPLGVLGYLIATGSFTAWLDVQHYNAQYVAHFSDLDFWEKIRSNLEPTSAYVVGVTRTMRVLFGLSLAALLSKRFRKLVGPAPLFLLAAFALDFYATSLSGLAFEHYYLQLVPAFALFSMTGAAWCLDLLRARGAQAFYALLLASVLLWDRQMVLAYVENLLEPSRRAAPGRVAGFIEANSKPDDAIWVQSIMDQHNYFESKRLAPTKYVYFEEHTALDTFLSTRSEKIATLKRDLAVDPPKFIVQFELRRRSVLSSVLSMEEWLAANYEYTGVSEYAKYAGGLPDYPVFLSHVYVHKDQKGSIASQLDFFSGLKRLLARNEIDLPLTYFQLRKAPVREMRLQFEASGSFELLLQSVEIVLDGIARRLDFSEGGEVRLTGFAPIGAVGAGQLYRSKHDRAAVDLIGMDELDLGRAETAALQIRMAVSRGLNVRLVGQSEGRTVQGLLREIAPTTKSGNRGPPSKWTGYLRGQLGHEAWEPELP